MWTSLHNIKLVLFIFWLQYTSIDINKFVGLLFSLSLWFLHDSPEHRETVNVTFSFSQWSIVIYIKSSKICCCPCLRLLLDFQVVENPKCHLMKQTFWLSCSFCCSCSKTDRIAKGAECYQKSISENPFLWSPFESLCQIGELNFN